MGSQRRGLQRHRNAPGGLRTLQGTELFAWPSCWSDLLWLCTSHNANYKWSVYMLHGERVRRSVVFLAGAADPLAQADSSCSPAHTCIHRDDCPQYQVTLTGSRINQPILNCRSQKQSMTAWIPAPGGKRPC